MLQGCITEQLLQDSSKEHTKLGQQIIEGINWTHRSVPSNAMSNNSFMRTTVDEASACRSSLVDCHYRAQVKLPQARRDGHRATMRKS